MSPQEQVEAWVRALERGEAPGEQSLVAFAAGLRALEPAEARALALRVAAAVELATAARDEAARALAELGRTRVGVRRYGGALRPLATTHQRVARRA